MDWSFGKLVQSATRTLENSLDRAIGLESDEQQKPKQTRTPGPPGRARSERISSTSVSEPRPTLVSSNNRHDVTNTAVVEAKQHTARTLFVSEISDSESPPPNAAERSVGGESETTRLHRSVSSTVQNKAEDECAQADAHAKPGSDTPPEEHKTARTERHRDDDAVQGDAHAKPGSDTHAEERQTPQTERHRDDGAVQDVDLGAPDLSRQEMRPSATDTPEQAAVKVRKPHTVEQYQKAIMYACSLYLIRLQMWQSCEQESEESAGDSSPSMSNGKGASRSVDGNSKTSQHARAAARETQLAGCSCSR